MKRGARVQCHVDGISITGVGSLRLSNIPKSLLQMGNLFLALGKNAHTALFYSYALFAGSAKADDCAFLNIGTTSDIYLTHSERNTFLLVHHDKDASFSSALNNTCGFFMENKQPGSYSHLDCACENEICHGPPPVCTTYYHVSLSAQNITDSLKKCIEDFINNYCDNEYKTSNRGVGLAVLGIVGGVIACMIGYACISRIREANRERSARFLEQVQIQMLNPVLNEDSTAVPSDRPSTSQYSARLIGVPQAPIDQNQKKINLSLIKQARSLVFETHPPKQTDTAPARVHFLSLLADIEKETESQLNLAKNKIQLEKIIFDLENPQTSLSLS